MRRGLVGLTVLLFFFEGCVSVGNYASPSLVGEGAWEMGVGTPIYSAKVDSGGVEISPGVYPEVFARYGVTENLELEGRAVVLPPLGGAVGGGFRWALVDSGFRVTAGLSATYFSLVENLTSPSTRWTTVVLYPGVWGGTDRGYVALRVPWAIIGADAPGGSGWVSGSLGIQFILGRRIQGRVFDALPEVTFWVPVSSESSPVVFIFLGLGITIHPERQDGG